MAADPLFSLSERIMFFFATAPDEELFAEDIMAKTGAASHHVNYALRTLRERGALRSNSLGPGGRRFVTYSLTPEALPILRRPLAPLPEDT